MEPPSTLDWLGQDGFGLGISVPTTYPINNASSSSSGGGGGGGGAASIAVGTGAFNDPYAVYKSFKLHRQYSVFFMYEQIASFYALLLIVIGTICNLTSFMIMMREKMRKYPCMRCLAILSLADVLVLYQWNLNTFYKYNLSTPPLYQDLEDKSIFNCRFLSFFAFFSLQTSSWLLSLVSFDRLMIVFSLSWIRIMTNKPARINVVIAVIVVTIFLLNVHIIFKNGYLELIPSSGATGGGNGTATTTSDGGGGGGWGLTTHAPPQYKVVCYASKDDRNYIFPNWQRIHLLMYNLIPFTIMLSCNSMIIYNMKFARKVQSKGKGSNKRIRKMTFTLIIVTFSFIILTLPSVIVHTFFHVALSTKPYRRLVNVMVNNLLHTSHAINFFLYICSGPNFRIELVSLLDDIKRRLLPSRDSSSGGGSGAAKTPASRTTRLTSKQDDPSHRNHLASKGGHYDSDITPSVCCPTQTGAPGEAKTGGCGGGVPSSSRQNSTAAYEMESMISKVAGKNKAGKNKKSKK